MSRLKAKGIAVNVYHLSANLQKDCIQQYFLNDPIIKFIGLEVPQVRPGTGPRTVLIFTYFVVRELFKKLNSGDVIVLVGSTFVAPIGIVIRLIFRKANILTWLRSIAAKELALRSPFIALLAAKCEKVLLNFSTNIIANGVDTYQYYAKVHPDIESKMIIIGNAVPEQKFFLDEYPDFRGKTVSIAYMGRFSKAKGFDAYINSINEYYKKVSDSRVEFHVYGHGEQEGLINSEKIIFHGKYHPSQTLDILRSHNVVIFLNRSGIAGGLSHSLLETMAAKRLIIAWDNLIHNQILNDNNAILVEEEDISALVDYYIKLNELTADDVSVILDKCNNAGTDAEKYTAANHTDKFLKLISK